MEKKVMDNSEIIEALNKYSYDVSEYKNLAANVHTIIGRLIKANEVRPVVPQPPSRSPTGLFGLAA